MRGRLRPPLRPLGGKPASGASLSPSKPRDLAFQLLDPPLETQDSRYAGEIETLLEQLADLVQALEVVPAVATRASGRALGFQKSADAQPC